jgi:hypothetical protein
MLKPHNFLTKATDNSLRGLLMKGLRFVVLDNVFKNLESTEVRDLFGQVILLKKRGYEAEYKPGVLPVDTTDMITSHLMVCRDTKEGLIPIMAYRSTEEARCLEYNLPFSALALMRACKAPDHEKALSLFLEQSKFAGVPVAYDSSLTMDPEARKDPELKKLLQELFIATHVHFHLNMGAPRVIAGGVVRFKMERYYELWGYRALNLNGKTLPDLKVPFVHDEVTRFFTLTKFSDETIKIADKYQSIFDNRIVIGEPKKKAA